MTARHRDDAAIAAAIAHMATPLESTGESYDAVLECIGDASIVLLGESTHGTHEFYAARAELTRRLVTEKGFSAVCLEADFPHTLRVHRYVRGEGNGRFASGAADESADDALAGFQRFPQWMWRNTVFVELVETLRSLDRKASVFGLDLYSLHDSMREVIAYLERADPEEAERARARYACFDHYASDPQTYGYVMSGLGGAASCEEQVVEQLLSMQRAMMETAGPEPFYAALNALVVKNAEAYYRAMYRGRVKSWNLRDTHMSEALAAVLSHLEEATGSAKVVVWAHNSHLGDARATELGRAGELNLGQLVRSRYGAAARLIGFSTYEGTVTAAYDWDGPAERRRVRRGMRGSYEELFHEAGVPRFFLDMRRLGEASGALREQRLQRAIGVIYRPESERLSHYFHARVAEQFDGIIHLDRTTALEPLEREAAWVAGEAPETWPSSL